MPEPRLLIDLGNSRIKWLWSRGAELELDSAGRGDVPALEQADHAVRGDSRLDLKPEALQPLGHVGGGPHLVEPGFGDAVQVPPVGDHRVSFLPNELTQGIHNDRLSFS